MKRYIFVIGLFLIVYGLSIGVPTIQAQPYPNRPIQVIIPLAPGSALDITGRFLVEELKKILGTQLIVINKPGASMTLGTDAVVRSKKDGYTIAYTGASSIVYTLATNPEIVPYDPFKDLEPLGLACFLPYVIAVQESSPWKTFSELIDYAKKNPGKLRVSTAGIGNTTHFALEMIQSLTGAEFTHVPYSGGGDFLVGALLGGHVEVIIHIASIVIPHVEAGKFRMLLVTPKMPEFPNVPTITELGYKQDLVTSWLAFYAPAGMPKEVKRVLVPAIENAVKSPELKRKISKLGFFSDYRSPSELKKLSIEDYETALAIAVKIGLRK